MKMENLVNKQTEQEQNKRSNSFNFTKENTLEVLNKYQMRQLKGGEGEQDDTNGTWT